MSLKQYLIVMMCVFTLVACSQREHTRIIVITSTPMVQSAPSIDVTNTPQPVIPTQPPTATLPPINLSPIPQNPLSNPTPNPTRPPIEIPAQHTVQAGETLSLIAQRYNLTLQAILDVNTFNNPDILSIGQVLTLPDAPTATTPKFKIIPDSRLVRSPESTTFDVTRFIEQQPGYIRTATDEVETSLFNGAKLPQRLTAAQVVERVALEYSVDPRVLLILLEYRAGWLTNPNPADNLKTHPLISQAASPNIDRAGLYKQLAWAANELNRGYYGWKYRDSVALSLGDGSRLLYDSSLNAGTIAVYYILGIGNAPLSWRTDVGLSGFYRTYAQFFGDPFKNAVEPLIPPNLQQPVLTLPFEQNVEWRFTGGFHGGWGSGSAWAALDFAPSSQRPANAFCYTASEYVTAIASGVIARAGDGTVILDLDGDGNEATGWTINYLHLTIADNIVAGLRVNVGDRLGQPSCAGGFSNATHLHISRRYNGEWLPADGATNPSIPPFTMDNWRAIGIEGQEYQGYMSNGSSQITAEQGRTTTINIITRQ